MQLIQGKFSAQEAIEIVTQLIHVKVKFHESKIQLDRSEDDIKMRERRIKQLQKDLYEFRNLIDQHPKNEIAISCEVFFEKIVYSGNGTNNCMPVH